MIHQITKLRINDIDAVVRVLVFVAIVCAFLASFGQLSEPFISHDDFDWLIPNTFDQGFETPWSKAATEGRWLNYPWSWLTIRLNINSAYYLFLGLAMWVCLSLAKLYTGRISVIAALLVFFSPPWGELSTWPVTQSSSVLITALSIMALNNLSRGGIRYVVLCLSVIGSLLTYPAYAAMMLIIFGATQVASAKELLKTAFTYVFSYFVGILIIFSLNWFFHDQFGITVAGWRHPTPLFPEGNLLENVNRYAQFWSGIIQSWFVLIISAIGYCCCFFANVNRSQCFAILLLSVLIIIMEASASIINGLDLPSRTSIWLWIAMISPILFIIQSKSYKLLPHCLAIGLLCFGINSWAQGLKRIYRIFPYAHSLGETLVQSSSANKGLYDKIIVFGDYKENHITAILHSNRHLRNYFYKKFGVYTNACEPELCETIRNELQKLAIVPTTTIINRNLILVLSPNVGWTY